MSDEQKQRDPRDVTVAEIGTCDEPSSNRKVSVRLVSYDGGPLKVAITTSRGRLGRIDPLTCARLSALLLEAAAAASCETLGADLGTGRECECEKSGRRDDSPNTKERS